MARGEKNQEDAWVDATDDYDGFERPVWQVDRCPMECQCSRGAWKNAKAWSYVGPEQVLLYVKNHLLVSSLHLMTEDAADELFWREFDWTPQGERMGQQGAAAERVPGGVAVGV